MTSDYIQFCFVGFIIWSIFDHYNRSYVDLYDNMIDHCKCLEFLVLHPKFKSDLKSLPHEVKQKLQQQMFLTNYHL